MPGQQEIGLRAVRLTRLGNDGLPVAPGTDGAVVTCDASASEVGYTFNTGAEIQKIGGNGNVCFYRKRPDSLKGGTHKLTLCSSSYRLAEMVLNGSGELWGGPDPTGFGLSAIDCGADAERSGVMVETWVDNYLCNVQNPTVPYKQKVIPRWYANPDGGVNDGGTAKDFTFSGDIVESVLSPTGGPAGPFDDWDDATVDKGYLTAEQNATVLPECSDEYIDTAVTT